MEEYFNGLLKEVDQRMATTAPGMDGKEVIGVCREMVVVPERQEPELKEYALAQSVRRGREGESSTSSITNPTLTGRSAVLLPGCTR